MHSYNPATKKTTLIFALIFALFLLSSYQTMAQVNGGVSIAPARLEVVIPAGTEKTVGMIVDYTRDYPEAELPMARLAARLEDWTLTTKGELKFSPINTAPRSAASWVTYGPSEFTLAADKRQIVRFTINVPKDTAPGDYYLACYVESRTPPPPPQEGTKGQVHVNYRYYSMIYVKVPGLTTEGELQDLQAKVENGFPIISPKLGNKGNSLLRPNHSVEIRDANDKIVFNSPMSEALAVLGGHSWQTPIVIDTELPTGTYKLTYSVDFNDKKALQIGKVNFIITDAHVAARKKKDDPKIVQNNNSNEKEKLVTPIDGQKEEATQKPSLNKSSDGPGNKDGAGKKTSISALPKKTDSSSNNFKSQ